LLFNLTCGFEETSVLYVLPYMCLVPITYIFVTTLTRYVTMAFAVALVPYIDHWKFGRLCDSVSIW